MNVKKYNCSILLLSVFFLIGCSHKEEKMKENVTIDFGEGIYRPTPFNLDNAIPFSWMGTPDSVKKETEIEVSFNEDAVRSVSKADLFLADSKGNRIKGVQIGNGNKEDFLINAKKEDTIISILFIVDPIVGDSLLTGSIMVAGDKLDDVNGTELLASATPVGTWQLDHQTGINWWRWIILILIVVLIVAILCLILYVLWQLLKILAGYISSLRIPRINRKPRKEKKPKRKRRKDPKPFKMNIALYQWLLPRLYDLPPVLFHISYFFLPPKIKTFLKDPEVSWLSYELWHRGKIEVSFKESIKSLFNGKAGISRLKYKHGEIDFEPVALGKVKLPLRRLHGCIPKNAIDPRPKVWKAQEKAAEKFIRSRKGKKILAEYKAKKKSDINMQDFKDWKEDANRRNKSNWNPLVPHETSDGAYILYVPHKYHSMGHNGGIHYLKKFRVYVDRKNKERQERVAGNSL